MWSKLAGALKLGSKAKALKNASEGENFVDKLKGLFFLIKLNPAVFLFIGAGILIALGLAIIIMIFVVMFISYYASEYNEQSKCQAERIEVTGTKKDNNITLRIESDENIIVDKISAKITVKNGVGTFTAKKLDENSQIMDLPKHSRTSPSIKTGASLNTFSYMPQFDQSLYTNLNLDKNSPQYKFNNSGKCTNKNGYRIEKETGAYLIALGSYYGSKIAKDKYKLTFKQDSGKTKTINAILGDQKADQHTDAKHQYHTVDGSVVEFIMAKRDTINAAKVNKDFGTLTSITKTSGDIILEGTIKKNGDIVIKGDVNGTAVDASGHLTEYGGVKAEGWYGDPEGCDDENDLGDICGFSYPWGKIKTPPMTSPSCKMRWGRIHHGVDYGMPLGSKLYSILPGRVIQTGYQGSRGITVMVNHGDVGKTGKDLISVQQHMLEGSVPSKIKPGAKVKAGQFLGKIGLTGTVTGAHLHYELHYRPKGSTTIVWNMFSTGSETCNPTADMLLKQLAYKAKESNDCVGPVNKQSAKKIINYANADKGKVVYIFGGKTFPFLDCSAWVERIFKKAGYNVGGTSLAQAQAGTKVSKSALQAGDIVILKNTYRSGVSHVGISLGGDKFIHNSSSARTVIVSSLNDSYWKPRFHSGRRVAK